jgi:methyltransferase (TIGR00027 family)
MHADRPSTTASLVAFMRALASKGATTVRDFEDPIATSLLPSPFARAARVFERAASMSRLVPKAAWLSTLGLLDMVPLRTAAIDEALREGLSGQLVILGAGLDARAYRLPFLRDTVVFEVDHPATGAWKRARVAELEPKAREVRFVSVDFERDRLRDALALAGHRADAPTFWIWEGVTMYLRREAVRATLDDVLACSARESRAAVTYLAPRVRVTPVSWLVERLDEPFVGTMTQATFADLAGSAGFRVLSDAGSRAWSQRYGRPPLVPWVASLERMAVLTPA